MATNYISKKSKLRIDEKKRNSKKLKKSFLIAFLSLVVIIGLSVIMLSVGKYEAEDKAIKALESDGIVSVVDNGKTIEFIPKGYDQGLIFYPGANVDAVSYAPLMKRLAALGILCVLVNPAFDYAFFEMNIADKIIDKYENVEWSIGGHSLGGVIASRYACRNEKKISGVLLLGSYANYDISDLSVLLIHGDKDEVLNMSRYEKSKKYLPVKYTEKIIEGGNHAYFGNYGEQKGDGEATITRETQQAKTVNYIVDWITR